MNSFYEHHKGSIRWHYRCFDRILLNGLIQPFQQPERVVGFFNTYRQLYPVGRNTLRSKPRTENPYKSGRVHGATDGGGLNMYAAIFVTVAAIGVGFAAPTWANDRPSDPFGNHTVELNDGTPLFEMWESLRDQVLLDKAHFHSCIESNNESNNTDCAAVSTLMKIVEEAGQNQGKALLGHLNRSINLLINAAPGYWSGPLEVITTRDGDCKSHSIAKYAAARVAGFSADHVRLVTLHNRRHNFDHMVAAVYFNEEWIILDNLTNVLVRDSDKSDYAPMAVLDYKGVRRYPSAFWMIE
jgi:predicted transglutaminase-like cysteine proteinase